MPDSILEKLAVIDVETTGLSPRHHEVIEVGCVVFEQVRQGGAVTDIKMIEEWECKLKPERIESADPMALKINGYKESDWHGCSLQPEGLEEFSKKITHLEPGPNGSQSINSLIIVGHNVYYDLQMLASSYERCGVNHQANKRIIDTYSFARAVLRADKSQRNFSLHALCERFDITNARAHSALADSRATFELYTKLVAFR